MYRAAAPDGLPVIEIDEADTALDVFGSRAPHLVARTRTCRDRAAVMFTSGTTGRPKGVEITQANYAPRRGHDGRRAPACEPSTASWSCLPMFHANAQFYSFASAIAVGAPVALMHTFSASRFLHQARDHAATRTPACSPPRSG